MPHNPSINTDWRDKAAPAGYVKRYAARTRAVAGMLLLVLNVSAIGRSNAEQELIPDRHNPSSLSSAIPLEDVLNPKTPMDGEFPVHHTDTRINPLAGGVHWMDNHRLIFTSYEYQGNGIKENIKVWDVDSNQVTLYGAGSVYCYQDGIIATAYQEKASDPWIFKKGLMGQEQTFNIKDYGRYFFPGDCDKQSSHSIREYMDSHPDELVSPLRKGDGFIVLGKKKMGGGLERQDFVTFHPLDHEPINLPLLNKTEVSPTQIEYYPFVDAYYLGGGWGSTGKRSTVKFGSLGSPGFDTRRQGPISQVH